MSYTPLSDCRVWTASAPWLLWGLQARPRTRFAVSAKRLLLVGYSEGIDSQHDIAWRAADSLAVRSFVRLALHEAAPRPLDDFAHAAPDLPRAVAVSRTRRHDAHHKRRSAHCGDLIFA